MLFLQCPSARLIWICSTCPQHPSVRVPTTPNEKPPYMYYDPMFPASGPCGEWKKEAARGKQDIETHSRPSQ